MADRKTWWLYMIECRGGGIYTGIALDVDRRYSEHATGRGAFYTKLNPPIRLLYREAFLDGRSASRSERMIKRMSRKSKLHFVITR